MSRRSAGLSWRGWFAGFFFAALSLGLVINTMSDASPGPVLITTTSLAAATTILGWINSSRLPRAPLVRYATRLFLSTAVVLLGLSMVAPSGWQLTLAVFSVISAAVALVIAVPVYDVPGPIRSGLSGGGERLSKSLTGLAARLAGRRRASDAEAWRAHLLGEIGSGRPLTSWQQLRVALGFLRAAVRMRWRDACRQLCRPLDWVVTRENRIAKLLVLVVCSAVTSLHRAGGWARVWDDFEQVGVLLGLVSGAAYGWRRLRGIQSEPRRRGEDS